MVIGSVRRHLAAAVVGALALAGGIGVAVAQVGGGDSPESPQGGVRGTGVPEGPFVSFCPTIEQTETHLKLYGFDYKPTVPCTREGEAPPPTAGQRADAAKDPDEDLSGAEICRRTKADLLNAKPLPDRGGGRGSLSGVLPDGREIVVQVFAYDRESLKGWTVRDEGKAMSC